MAGYPHGGGRAFRRPEAVLAASPSCLDAPRSPARIWRSTLGGKKKTTFAKLNREAKLREKRHAKGLRKEQRQRAAEAGDVMQHQPEDLSHLDVAVMAGVEPD